MNKFFLGLIFLNFACSHQKISSEVVNFPYAQELLGKIQEEVAKKPIPSPSEELKKKSPKRVYFSVLFNQYQTLGQVLKEAKAQNEISFCPQFHHDKTLLEARPVMDVKFFKRKDVSGEIQDYFPETAFLSKKSLKDYHQKMREELDTLCEEGVSDNYFKFDNLITHYAHQPTFHRNPSAMKSVLKIPVFANFYLINMVSPAGVVSISEEEKGLIELTRTYWFEDYVLRASVVRKTVLQEVMASR